MNMVIHDMEVTKNDFNEILDDLAKVDGDAQRLDGELKGIFEGLGYKWGRS